MRKMFSEKQIKEMIQVVVDNYELKADLEDDVIDIVEDAEELNLNGDLTANSIIENMSGYSFTKGAIVAGWTATGVYAGVVKNGNKITFVVAYNIKKTSADAQTFLYLGRYNIPTDILDKIYPSLDDLIGVDSRKLLALSTNSIDIDGFCEKGTTFLSFGIAGLGSLVVDTDYYVRYELTLLLSENLIGE